MSVPALPAVLYASNNSAKVEEARKFFSLVNMQVFSLSDLGLSVDADENYNTLEQNACEKTFLAAVALKNEIDKYIVLGDDTGLEIESLKGEPGTRVRRWAGHKMTDEEIISLCLSKMEGFQSPDQRKGVMRTAICAKFPGSEDLFYYSGVLKGEILRTADPMRIPGFPLESIFFVDECGKLLGEVWNMDAAEKSKYPTHREKALLLVLEAIKKRMSLR